MTTCPECGQSINTDKKNNNHDRSVTITIPEWQVPLFRKVFGDMSTKMGMVGLGELANQMQPYRKQFQEEWERFRYFDDAALATAMTGVHNGYPAKVRLGKLMPARGISDEPRQSVFIDFTLDSGKIKSITVADSAIESAALWFVDHFTDFTERHKPQFSRPA